MKTIYLNKIYDVIGHSPLEEDETATIILKSDTETVHTAVTTYAHYEYQNNPLFFIPVGLNDISRLLLIKKFDEWYGNTNQCTPYWALEFQLVVRMLLCDYLIVNPQYLELDEIIIHIQDIICANQKKDKL